MLSVYQLKPGFQALLRPVVKLLATLGVSANAVTLLAAGLSMLVGLCIARWPQAHWPLLLLPGFLLLRMALNAIDGMLAREHQMQSRLGALLNEMGDVVSDCALYLPLALVAGVAAPLIVLITLLTVISELAGVLAVMIGAARQYQGPMGKSDRALVFGALGLWLGLGGSTGRWLDVLLSLILLLLLWTCYNRLRAALRHTIT